MVLCLMELIDKSRERQIDKYLLQQKTNVHAMSAMKLTKQLWTQITRHFTWLKYKGGFPEVSLFSGVGLAGRSEDGVKFLNKKVAWDN